MIQRKSARCFGVTKPSFRNEGVRIRKDILVVVDTSNRHRYCCASRDNPILIHEGFIRNSWTPCTNPIWEPGRLMDACSKVWEFLELHAIQLLWSVGNCFEKLITQLLIYPWGVDDMEGPCAERPRNCFGPGSNQWLRFVREKFGCFVFRWKVAIEHFIKDGAMERSFIELFFLINDRFNPLWDILYQILLVAVRNREQFGKGCLTWWTSNRLRTAGFSFSASESGRRFKICTIFSIRDSSISG